jgi:drug/metabolite transporter (DMT)-like permease
MSRRNAVFLVLLSAIGFGSIGLFAKFAYTSGISPTMLLTMRFVLAALLLAPVIVWKRIPLPRGRVLVGFIVMGMLYSAQSQSFFTALLHASSGLVALLLYIYPALVTIMALLLGWEKLERRTLVLLALALAGTAVTLGGKLEGEPLGIALGLLAAMIYAVYILVGDKLTRGVHPLAATFVVLASAGAINGAMAIADGTAMPQGVETWLAIGAIALFSTVLAIAAFLAGIKYIGAAQASIISTMEPVVTLTLGVSLLNESLSATQLLGGAMVLTAVILLARRPAMSPRAPAAMVRSVAPEMRSNA